MASRQRRSNAEHRVLGAPAEGDETHVELRTAGAQLTILSFDGMEQMAPGSMHGAAAGNIILGFEVQDVDAEYDRLRALAVEIMKLPASYPWSSRSVWFRDPDGNIVDFFARLAKDD